MKYADFNNLVTPKVSTKFGAPLGRNDINKVDILELYPAVTVRRVNFSSCGAYDIGGAYWGLGKNLYVIYSKCGTIVIFMYDKNLAKKKAGLINAMRKNQMNKKSVNYLDL